MKRLWVILLSLLALFALTVGTASALEAFTPINDEVVLKLPSGDLVPNSDYTLKVTGSLTTGNDVTFTAEGGTITSFLMGYERPWSSESSVEAFYVGKNVSEFTYHFMEPGEYYFFINGSYAGSRTVTGDDLLASRISEIMTGCTATDQYEIALWIHDWLATNTYYDSTLTYHGADYLLNQGWGVCQSYASAYYLMLETKGIDVEYISSSEQGHAWNAVSLNGKWYEADVTWDTMGKAKYGEGSPKKYTHHTYFMMSDLLLRNLPKPHYGHSDKYITLCVSMDDNYYVRSGYAQQWLDDGVEASLGLKYTENQETAEITVSSQGEDVTSSSYVNVPAALCASAMAQVLNGAERTGKEGIVYSLAATADATKLSVVATMKEPDYDKYDTVRLPANTTAVGSESFANTAMQVIVIPSGATSVASDAFKDCKNLEYIVNYSKLTITAPDGVRVINK